MNWFEVANAAEIPSPALFLFRARIAANLAEMLRVAGDTKRLRPHLKTHKLPELVQWQVELGITKFKTATIAEAELAASHGAQDVLLAYQPVGPHIGRLFELMARFPETRFSCLADNSDSVSRLAQAALAAGKSLTVFLDLDVGQGRTGIGPGGGAFELYRQLASERALLAGGLHAYDGHIYAHDLAVRLTECDAAFGPVEQLRRRLEAAGLKVPVVVAGGSPTFPLHARREGVELSPGTTVLWDAGYAHKLPDMNFQPAAVLLTRVVSQPAPNRLCLDLGHKAVASEMPHPRVVFLNLPEATPVMHSEEHLVVETPTAAKWAVGDCIYALPWHVCPTVALHEEVVVVDDAQCASARWTVTARRRRLTL
jgi:D-serine deaminase-like pyridoxal phosphate-dependent protein